MNNLQSIIEAAWEDREKLRDKTTVEAIDEVVDRLDKGTLRVAEPNGDKWTVHVWIKKAIILYFPTHENEVMEV